MDGPGRRARRAGTRHRCRPLKTSKNTNIADGHCRKEIAASLGVSLHTVHTHVKLVYRKLHVAGRDDAIQRARQPGIIAGG